MNSDGTTAPSQTPAADAAVAPFVNIAAYRFVALHDLEERRSRLTSLCRSLDLKGTILLSPEGINLFLAGKHEAIEAFLEHLEQDADLAGMAVKRSLSPTQPFARMKIKLKREIIPFGIQSVDPARQSAPTVAPATLRRWLSEGRELTLLDVRNDYEIEYGTFAGAQTLGLDHFRNLPAAIEQLDEKLRERPLVMFCTGGIRCEKAGPYLQQQGFREVYQLDGGILQYFEDCGDAHYRGDCFVFDERVAVDPRLQPITPPAPSPWQRDET